MRLLLFLQWVGSRALSQSVILSTHCFTTSALDSSRARVLTVAAGTSGWVNDRLFSVPFDAAWGQFPYFPILFANSLSFALLKVWSQSSTKLRLPHKSGGLLVAALDDCVTVRLFRNTASLMLRCHAKSIGHSSLLWIPELMHWNNQVLCTSVNKHSFSWGIFLCTWS